MKTSTRDVLIFGVLLFACALFAHGQGVFVPQQTALKNVNGLTTPIASATVTVCAANASGIPCSPALTNTIFKDAAFTQSLSNPFTADAQGNYQFAVAPGTFTVTVTALGFNGNSYQVTAGSGGGSSGGSTTWPTITGGVSNGQTFTLGSSNFNLGGTGGVDLSLGNPLSALKLPLGAGAAPVGTGFLAYDSTQNDAVFGNGTLTIKVKDWASIYQTAANTRALQMGTGGSLFPTGTGQVASNQLSMAPGLIAPSASMALAGGSLLTARATSLRYTFSSAAGQTLGSVQLNQNNVAYGCSSGSACLLTVIAPTLPPGYTSWNLYAQDCNAACGGNEQLQAACTNLGAGVNCVIGSIGAGAAVPTVNAAYLQPPNVQASLCAPGILPSIFQPKADGNSYTLGGVDFSNGSPLPAPNGTAVICGRWFVTDSGLTIQDATQTGGGLIRNALLSVGHLSGVATSSTAADDRAIAYRMTDNPNGSTSYGQFLGLYGEAFVYNNNFNCTPVGGTPSGQEDCFAGIRVRANDQRTAGVNNINLVGGHFTASTNVAAPKLGSCLPCVVGVMGSANQETAASPNAGGAFYAGVVGMSLATAGNTNGSGFSLWASSPAVKFATQNGGLFIVSAFSAANDFGIRSDATANSRFQGNIQLPTISADKGTVTVTASLAPNGVSTIQFSTPSAPTVTATGVTGATSYTYKIVAKDAAGGTSIGSALTNVANGNATLTGSNFNRITFAPGTLGGVSSYDVYRTASSGTPSSTGKIGTFTITDSTNGVFIAQQFDDTGLAGDGTTVPATNTSGNFATPAFLHSALNTVALGSNFTTAANTNLQAFLTREMDTAGGARNYTFHCALAYSQATAVVAVAFGIQAATVAPTNIFATGDQQITVGPPATYVSGTLATLNTITATNIVSGTPGATATNYTAKLDGTIELPTGTNTINWMVSTANSGDLVTMLRGSYCQLFPQ